jgi:monovalent cation/hydrogen antiporter
VEWLRRSCLARLECIETADEENQADSTVALYRKLRRGLLAVERDELHRLFEVGKISDAIRRRIQRTLDLEEAGLGEHDG